MNPMPTFSSFNMHLTEQLYIVFGFAVRNLKDVNIVIMILTRQRSLAWIRHERRVTYGLLDFIYRYSGKGTLFDLRNSSILDTATRTQS